MKRFTMFVAVLSAISFTSALNASTDQNIIRAQGNPWLVNFMSSQSKRADLRIAVSRKGFDAAFSDWLRVEQPSAYRSAVKDAATAEMQAQTCKGACCTASTACCKN